MAEKLLTEIMQLYPNVFPIAGPNTPGGVTSRKTGTETDLGEPSIIKGGLGLFPTGTPVKKYISGEVDGRAFIYWYISYPNAGALVTSISVPFPASAPQPFLFSGWPNNSWVYPGSGGLLTANNDLANGGAQCGIYKESDGSLTLKTVLGITGIAAKLAIGFVGYATNP